MNSQRVGDAGAELGLAHWLLEELCVPADFGTRDIVAQAIRMEGRRVGVDQAAKVILERAQFAQLSGERINRFWFTDRKYADTKPISPPIEHQSAMTDAEAYEMWQSMSEEYRKANPWRAQ